ncbi:hypothetical protein KUTeg_008620 [Tegillarca granosa]|uniref:Uncharacterized protein n=1 Tax=Tegillarca granosa TaxID=220873 RepID=A0ABQ9F9M2_TEGGR|nr:hypothetical protein KUTeg_008620 [Tegillarca granosa]
MLLLRFLLVIGALSFGECRLENDNCWELVFRGLSGIGKQIYQAWTKTTSNPCTLAGGCISNNLDLAVATLPNNTHLKSPLVDQWSTLNIEQRWLTYAKRFSVVQEGMSCTPAYYWWMTIADYRYSNSGYRCLFEKTGAYPLLIYAPSQHKSKFNDPKISGFRLAKAMTIHIKRRTES